MIPKRHKPDACARQRFGDRIDRLGPLLLEGDPLADEAVEALAALPVDAAAREQLITRALERGIAAVPEAPAALAPLFAQLDHVPFWFDAERANRGGVFFLRAGPLAGMVLGLKSLVCGYCSPSGNKPLTFSGRLREDVARRLTETSRFVQTISVRGGMMRDKEGFHAAARVRLMHARVRRMLLRSPRWTIDEWGLPINQFDMAATVLLFSHAVTEGLRTLGYRVRPEEAGDLLHLWRYVGYVMGVKEELLPSSEHEAAEFWDMLRHVQDPPDDDSRALAKALLEHPLDQAHSPPARARAARQVRFGYALSRFLIGDQYADALDYPRAPWGVGLRAFRVLFTHADRIRQGLPGADRLALAAGVRYWEAVVRAGAGGTAITFSMPERLGAS